MGNELIKKNFKDIANSIRAKTGENGLITAEEMPSKIENSLAKKPEGSLSITANGDNIDVSDKATINVNVPNPSTGTLDVTENGRYNVTEKAEVNVNVPSPTFESNSIYLTDENGEVVDNEEAEGGRIYWEYDGELHSQGNFHGSDFYRYNDTDKDYEAFSRYDLPYSSSNMYYYTSACDPFSGVDVSEGDLCVYKGSGEFASAGSVSGGNGNLTLVYWDAGSSSLHKSEMFDLNDAGDEVTVEVEGIGSVKITKLD